MPVINENYVHNMSSMVAETAANDFEKLLVGLKILRDIRVRPTDYYRFLPSVDTDASGFNILMQSFVEAPEDLQVLDLVPSQNWHPEPGDYARLMRFADVNSLVDAASLGAVGWDADISPRPATRPYDTPEF